ncbi:hypothetical protein DSUL_20505 [Desulfovibrionales bacterium]
MSGDTPTFFSYDDELGYTGGPKFSMALVLHQGIEIDEARQLWLKTGLLLDKDFWRLQCVLGPALRPCTV